MDEGSKPSQWRCAQSKLNPAQYASRDLSAKNISLSHWLKAPEFLRNYEDE